MIVVITEKPSVAREIASVIGATERKEGYITGNGYHVTWAFGHLLTLAMPKDYGVSGFEKSSLPIVPDPFILMVRKIKKGKEYVSDPCCLQQLKVIEKLFKSCESIIVATDAGREGELIFRYIYEYLHCSKPFKRLWISSLTENSIKEGFINLKSGYALNSLYTAALCRSHADWLVGINVTQALSIASDDGVYSLGRVQTPTLAMICKRYLENRQFISEKFWQIELHHHKEYLNFKTLSVIKWNEKKEAERALRSIEKSGTAIVSAVEKKVITEQPPLLYDLTGLQKDANQRFNFYADETLDIAQRLYEKKFITYPRTGSKYIPDDMWHEIPKLLRTLQSQERFRTTLNKVNIKNPNKRIVDDVLVTDHHALLITGRIPSALSEKENLIYELIVFRMLEALSQACKKAVMEIKIEVLHYEFMVKGHSIEDYSWRAIRGNLSDDLTENIIDLPELKVGDQLKIKESSIIEKKTQPPALYMEASLLAAMENAGNKLEEEQERKILKDIGIGTPATRSEIFKTLVSRNYIGRERRKLIPTEKGLEVYNWVKEMSIADVSMAAGWELAFHRIECNELDSKQFENDIIQYTSIITEELLSVCHTKEDSLHLACPVCNTQYLNIGNRIVQCQNTSCNWTYFRNVCGVKLPDSEIEKLIVDKKTSLIKNMSSKSGKRFDAFILLDQQCKSYFEFSSSDEI